MSQPSRVSIVPSDGLSQLLNAKAARKGWEIVCDSSLVCEHPSLNAMAALWRTASRDGLPARSHLRTPDACASARRHFSIRDMAPFLRDMLIIEIVREGKRRRYKHTFVGMRFVQKMGEITGKYLDEFLPPHLYERTSTYYDAVLDTRCALRIVTNFEHRPVNHTSGEALCMPLADDGQTPNKLMLVANFGVRKTSLRPN